MADFDATTWASGNNYAHTDQNNLELAVQGAQHFAVHYAVKGELEVAAGTFRYYPPVDCELIKVTASLGTAPTGASVKVDVLRDGATVFSPLTNQIEIAISGFFDSTTSFGGTTTFTADTNYVTVDVDQIGSTLPGEDLTVTLYFKRNDL